MNNLIKNITAEILLADSTPTPKSYRTTWRQLPCGVLCFLHVPGHPEYTGTAALLVRHGSPDLQIPGNSVLFVPAGEEHCILTVGDGIVSDWMHISCTCTPGIEVTSFFTLPRIYSSPETVSSIGKMMKIIIKASPEQGFAGGIIANLTGAAIMSLLLQEAEPERDLPLAELKRLSPALALLRNREGRRFTNRELAASCFLSESRFRALFRHTVGMSPGQYAEKERIGAAITLLSRGVTLSEAASQLAYSDISHFSRSFHKAMGTSPGAYRKKILSRSSGSTGNSSDAPENH